eukprot:scaffold964_cov170-Amphora_coffeaeformis.AAC.6
MIARHSTGSELHWGTFCTPRLSNMQCRYDPTVLCVKIPWERRSEQRSRRRRFPKNEPNSAYDEGRPKVVRRPRRNSGISDWVPTGTRRTRT